MQCPNCQAEIPSSAKFCPECGKTVPKKTSSGVNLGDVGLIHTLNIGTGKEPPAPGGDYCPICGVWVKLEDSFRCKGCGRSGLHREHRDPELNLCSECAAQVRPVQPAPQAPPKAVHQGNEFVLALAPGVEMTFLRVPAGAFLMGSAENDLDASSDEKPRHKVHLEEYWIGKTPVTNARSAAFVAASGHDLPDEDE